MDDDSILLSVRKRIGPSASYDVFDTDLIVNINMCFSRLCQLGVGPTSPFKLVDDQATWDDFMEGGQIDDVKQYVYLKTRLIFDPPESGTVMNAYKEEIEKLEWLLKEVARFGY